MIDKIKCFFGIHKYRYIDEAVYGHGVAYLWCDICGHYKAAELKNEIMRDRKILDNITKCLKLLGVEHNK